MSEVKSPPICRRVQGGQTEELALGYSGFITMTCSGHRASKRTGLLQWSREIHNSSLPSRAILECFQIRGFGGQMGWRVLLYPMFPHPDSPPTPGGDVTSRLSDRFAGTLAEMQACAEADPPIPLCLHQHHPQPGCSAKPDGIFTLGHRVGRAQRTDCLQ